MHRTSKYWYPRQGQHFCLRYTECVHNGRSRACFSSHFSTGNLLFVDYEQHITAVNSTTDSISSIKYVSVHIHMYLDIAPHETNFEWKFGLISDVLYQGSKQTQTELAEGSQLVSTIAPISSFAEIKSIKFPVIVNNWLNSTQSMWPEEKMRIIWYTSILRVPAWSVISSKLSRCWASTKK